MIDRQVLGQNLGEYEQERSENKLGKLAMISVFIKNTIGLSIFGYHIVYKTSGYSLGSLVSLIFIYTVIHGAMRTVTYAEEVESTLAIEGYHTDTYAEMAELMFDKDSIIGKIVGPMILLLNFFSCIGYIIATTIAFSDNLIDATGCSSVVARLTVFMITMACLYMMKQPEKLVYLSYFALLLVVTLVMTSSGFAVVSLVKDGPDRDYIQSYRFDGLSISSGYAITCLEVISFVLNIRRMSANKSQFKKVGYGSLYFCSTLYMIPAMLLYLAYGSEIADVQLYYKIFTKYWPVKILNMLMNVNFLFGMCSLTMFNLEMLEKIRITQQFLRDENHNLRTWNVLICRFSFLALVIFLSFFIKDLRLVNALTGIFLNSFIGMIIPGFLGLARPRIHRKNDSFVTVVSDSSCIFFGIVSIALYIYETL